jgi:hypothetical protein
MTRTVTCYAGAPLRQHLDWEERHLINDLIPQITEFLKLEFISSSAVHTPGHEAVWRRIETAPTHLPTGLSQNNGWVGDYDGNAAYLAAVDPSWRSSMGWDEETSFEEMREVTSQFYEHSLAIHDDLVTSQIVFPDGSSNGVESQGVDSYASSHLMGTLSPSVLDESDVSVPRVAPLAPGPLTDLRALPNAKHLLAVQPQTVTVNLVVGIISTSPPRAIQTRRGAEVELLELLVGDSTKSGFPINFWLSSSRRDERFGPDLRETLEALRRQDIVLLQNVALSSFRGQVFGQSLHRGMTKVHLLHRSNAATGEHIGYYNYKQLENDGPGDPLLAHTRRVKDWILKFVATHIAAPAPTQHAGNIGWQADCPPDTQV